MKEVFEKFPHWKTSEKHEMEIIRQLYKVLVNAGIKENIDRLGNKIMTLLTGRSR